MVNIRGNTVYIFHICNFKTAFSFLRMKSGFIFSLIIFEVSFQTIEKYNTTMILLLVPCIRIFPCSE